MKKIKEFIFSNKEEKTFKNSLFYLLKFYICLIILVIPFYICFINLRLVFIIILGGNLVISIITQLIHYHNDIYEKEKRIDLKAKKLFYQGFRDCVIRCSAGIFELFFYAIFFAVGLWEIIVGYLILKTLSIWKPETSKKDDEIDKTIEKGVSTAGLRIAVVFSLIFALWASHFLNLYWHDTNFYLSQYNLFIK